MGKQLLTLETLEKDRDFVTIDGKDYELMSVDDFGLLEQAKFNRFLKTIQDLQDNKLSDSEVERAIGKLRDLVAMILPAATTDVIKKLTDSQLQAVATAFLEEKRKTEDKRTRQREQA